MRSASTKAWVPAAQAATDAITGPVMPKVMETWQAPMFGANIGMKKGLTRFGPRLWWTRTSRVSVWIPPPPVLIITPTRSLLLWSMVRPASSIASRAAATANCE